MNMSMTVTAFLTALVLTPLTVWAQGDAVPELEARRVLEAFFEAFNAADNEAMRDTLNFPHAFLINFSEEETRFVMAQDRSELSTNFDGMRQSEGWAYSTLDSVVYSRVSPVKVHCELVFSRYKTDGTIYWTVPALWIVTKQDGHWGVQFRSLMPAVLDRR